MSSKNKAQSEHSGIIFMKVLYHLIHTARIHKDNNQLTRDCLSRFKGILDNMTKDDDLKIQIWRGRFHVNGEKLPHRKDTVNIIDQIMKYFSGRGDRRATFSSNFQKCIAERYTKFYTSP